MQAGWFFRQLRPLLPSYFVSVALVVLSSLMFLLDPLLMKWLIDQVLPRKDFRLLLFAAAGFFALYVFRLGFLDRKSTRLNSSHSQISYAVFCLKKTKYYT